jgi:hypothetical protein
VAVGIGTGIKNRGPRDVRREGPKIDARYAPDAGQL